MHCTHLSFSSALTLACVVSGAVLGGCSPLPGGQSGADLQCQPGTDGDFYCSEQLGNDWICGDARQCELFSDDTPELSERFVGNWLLHETVPHALDGATTYQLAANGTLELLWDLAYYERPFAHVVSPDESISCFLGTHWQSEGDDTLILEGDCSDGESRDIVLHFSSQSTQNLSGATTEILHVGNESGWTPPRNGWAFQKCAANEICKGIHQ